MAMSLASRREYLRVMRKRYQTATSREQKGQIIDEVVLTCGYHRKYAIRALDVAREVPKPKRRRIRLKKYQEALPVVQIVWEALDYPCAERLHPVLLQTAEQLAAHGELHLAAAMRVQLASISRATLSRRLAELPSPKIRRVFSPSKPGILRQSEVPIGRYDWDEGRPGALEIDLVEHNGGNSSGHYAYTLSVVDIVTGWSRRRAVLGKGQRGIHEALSQLIAQWPYKIWALHSDNGSEFLNHHIIRFAQLQKTQFTRGRPYRKNDNAHVEQRNRQFVRDVVGYARYDTPEQVDWLNQVYAILDPYANLFLPTRKLASKTREGSHVRKRYDTAKTPYGRACDKEVLPAGRQAELASWIITHNPLALHRQLERLISRATPTILRHDEAAD